MFFKKRSDSYSYLIVGLGNPGSKYDGTRHNVGFAAVEELADELSCHAPRTKHKSEVFTALIGSQKCLMIKPLTYMNNSGEAVKDAADYYKIPPENIIVISDDVSLNVGQLRIRRKGSAGGHNGLKSIIAHLGSENFIRVKIGVGKKPHPDYDLADWVLGKFKKDDLPLLRPVLLDSAAAVKCIIESGTDAAMNKYNR